MKSAFVIFVLLATSTTSAIAEGKAFSMPSLIGEPPSSAITSWTRLLILGEIHAPLPVEWISTHRFLRPGFEHLVVVRRSQYTALIKAVPTAACVSSLAGIKEKRRWRALQVTQYYAGAVRECTLARDSACAFVSKISGLSDSQSGESKAGFRQTLDGALRCHDLSAEGDEREF